MVDVGDRVIEVTPVTVRDLPDFLAAIDPVARHLADGDIMGAMARNADSVIEAVRIGSRVERDWLDDQPLDVLARLAVGVIEVNADFFNRHLLPIIEQAADRIEAVTQQTGGENL